MGEIRDVPAMDTTGSRSGMGEDALAAYVEDKAQRLNDDTVLAGVDGYLEEAEESNLVSYLSPHPRAEKASN
jgi:hypothetical protein